MVVTVDRFARAVAKALEVSPEEATSLAERILNYFGFRRFIIDNLIDQDDRKLFYQFHDAGLLRSSWETVLLPSGRSWRIFYWELNEEDVERVLEERPAEEREPLYDRLPDEYWGRTVQQT